MAHYSIAIYPVQYCAIYFNLVVGFMIFFFFFLIFFWPEGNEKICQQPPVTRNFCHNYDMINASNRKKYILCFCKNVKRSLIAGDVIILIIVMAYKF